MMKRSVLALAIALGAITSFANAAEIYNKDGNKLDLYGRVNAKHYFSDSKSNDGDMTYVRLGFKGETQINDQLASGNTTSRPIMTKRRALPAPKRVWASRG